jgi:Zn finger protein HypA/HybF involved in hydrogenase expression
VTNENVPPRFVRTQQDAEQFVAAYDSFYEKTRAEALQNPAQGIFKTVKPPFKCADCKRKIKLSVGYKLGKDKICEKCSQAALVKGYQQVKRSEALTGRRILSDASRYVCEQLSKQAAQNSEAN